MSPANFPALEKICIIEMAMRRYMGIAVMHYNGQGSVIILWDEGDILFLGNDVTLYNPRRERWGDKKIMTYEYKGTGSQVRDEAEKEYYISKLREAGIIK